MRVIEARERQLHLEVGPDDLAAINNTLAWVVHGDPPVDEKSLVAKTGLSLEAASRLLDRISHEETAGASSLWFSADELRSTERLLAGVLDGEIDILNDWQLIGVDEERYAVTHREIQRFIETAGR